MCLNVFKNKAKHKKALLKRCIKASQYRMENVLGQVNVATTSLESATTGIIQGFIQDDINQEVMSLQLENVDAKTLIGKLEYSSEPLLSETKELLSKVVKNNLSRIEALQTQIGD